MGDVDRVLTELRDLRQDMRERNRTQSKQNEQAIAGIARVNGTVAVLATRVGNVESNTGAMRKTMHGNGDKSGGCVAQSQRTSASVVWLTWGFRLLAGGAVAALAYFLQQTIGG